MSRFPSLHVLNHPLIAAKLTGMRRKETKPLVFRTLLREITFLMAYEAMKDLKLTETLIETPVAPMKAPTLEGLPPVLVPVLRAGLGMAEPLMELLPAAAIGHIGVYRDHETKEPVEYLVRLPADQGQPFVLIDPMLATGHSLAYATDILNKHGIPDSRIRAMVLVAAPEGVETYAKAHPTIPVFAAALDEKLNENAYIVPGLGDAGDRLFGTFA